MFRVDILDKKNQQLAEEALKKREEALAKLKEDENSINRSRLRRLESDDNFLD